MKTLLVTRGFEFVNNRPGQNRKYVVDNSKLKSLGWEPTYSEKFKETLKELCK